MTHYFYVLNTGGSAWEVRSSHEPTRTFLSKEAAVAAARHACQQKASRKRPCGVRIQHGIADWVDDQVLVDEEA